MYSHYCDENVQDSKMLNRVADCYNEARDSHTNRIRSRIQEKRGSCLNIDTEFSVVSMQSTTKLCFVSMVVLLFALLSMLMILVSAAGIEEEATSAISEAERLLAKAYETVLDAESADADVSGLLVRLNDVAALLSEARMAFDVGDFEEAAGFAESTSEVGYEIVDEAELFEMEAANARVHNSWGVLVISVLGVSVVVVSSLVGYSFFKRRYYRRLSKMKPRIE